VVQRNGLGKLAVLSNHQHTIPTRASIWVEIHGKRVSEHQLSKRTHTIGRFPGSDIQILSQRVSRFHAIIHWKGGSWVIEDVESLNGLSCQGQRVDQLALVHGDCIHIDSSIVLRYEEEN